MRFRVGALAHIGAFFSHRRVYGNALTVAPRHIRVASKFVLLVFERNTRLRRKMHGTLRVLFELATLCR